MLAAFTALSGVAFAQTPATPNKATLRQWDIYGATGSTQNVLSVLVDSGGIAEPVTGGVWFVSKRPEPRLGFLNPANNQYKEWQPVTGAGSPRAIVLNTTGAPTTATGRGDIWFTNGNPALVLKRANSNLFRKYQLTDTGGSIVSAVDPYGVAVFGDGTGTPAAGDGTSAILTVFTGSTKGVWKVPRGAAGNLAAPQTVGGTYWTLGALDFPGSVAVDSRGFIWFLILDASTYMGRIARLDPNNMAPTGANPNVIEWQIPQGTTPSGLTVVNGANGASAVCAVVEGDSGAQNGEVYCFDVPAAPATTPATFRRISALPGYDVPQRAALNASGDLIVTERDSSAITFMRQNVLATAPAVTVTPTTRPIVPATQNVEVTEVTVAPEPTITIGAAHIVDNPNMSGTPALDGRMRWSVPTPDANQAPQPVGLSLVTDDAGNKPGTVFVAEYFDGLNRAAAGRVTRVTVNVPAPPQLRANGTLPPANLVASFTATEGQAPPSYRDFAIDEETGATVTWSPTVTIAGGDPSGWVTVEQVDTAGGGTNPPTKTTTPATLRVKVNHASLAPRTQAYVATIALGGPNGATGPSITVTLVVTPKPTIRVLSSHLSPEPGYFGKFVFIAVAGLDQLEPPIVPAPQSFTIENTGGGTLSWSSLVSIDPANPNKSVGPATISVTPGSGLQDVGAPATIVGVRIEPKQVPGIPDTYHGIITLSSTNATNAPMRLKVILNVIANPGPTLTLPPSALAVEATSASGATVSFTASAIDVFGAAVPVQCMLPGGAVATSPRLFGLDTSTTIACSATDSFGKTSTGQFTVIVRDLTPPVIAGTPMANMTADATSGAGGIVSYTVPDASDTVDGAVTPVCLPASGSLFTAGVTPVTCTVKDAHNNAAVAGFTVTVGDTGPPSLTVPPNQTAPAAGAAGAVVTYPPATATDAVSNPVTITYSHQSGATFPLGVTTVTVTATDAAGNAATGTFTVTVSDSAPPVFTQVPGNMTVQATGAAGAVVTFAATATDNTGTPTITYAPAPGSTFALGTTPVAVTATDVGGLTVTATFNVTVVDTTKPALTVPANLTIEATSAAGAIATFAAAATDASGPPTITYSQSPGSLFPLGTTNVIVTATDSSNNVETASFTVAVRDTTPPSITPPPNQVVDAPDAVAVSYPAATASDAVSLPVTIEYSHSSGATFPLGATTVTVTARDAIGLTATASFTVTVRITDVIKPVFTSVPANIVAEATSASGAAVSFPAATATDTVSAVTIAYSKASGTTFALGTTTVTVTATDVAGNYVDATFTITVVDTTKPVFTFVPPNQTVQAGGPVAVTFPAATATDAVSTPTMTYSPLNGSVFPVGTTTVTATARDAAGNTQTATFTVTVSLAAASFTVTPASLYFKTGRLAYCGGIPVGPNWKDQGLAVQNTGVTPLILTSSTATEWIKPPVTTTIAAGATVTLTVSVDISGVSRGIYQGSLTLTGGAASKLVPVTLEIGNALPTLCLTPRDTPLGSVKAGKPSTTKYFDITNVGDDALGAWSIVKTATQGTVTTSLTSGTGPKTIGVSVKAGNTKGSQSGKVTVNASGAVQSGTFVALTWTVQ